MTKHSRTYESWVDDSVKLRLGLLLEAAAPGRVSDYRQQMSALGMDLGRRLEPLLPTTGDIVFVTTVEDADFLSHGVVSAIELGDRLKLFCYWNERDAHRDTAPIISRYEEPIDESRVSAVVIAKSVISGACVVRTNLIETLAKLHHDVPVFVVAPVMHSQAKTKLRREFEVGIAARFQFITCAVDSEKDGENVKPGIGGSVYELLGLGDKHTKNRVRPRILSQRAATAARSAP
jgi:hypothetical protein